MRNFLFAVLVCLIGVATGQDSVRLTLDDCINIGLERNIALKRASNAGLIARANAFQAYMNFFPSFSASINYDFTSGNFFDINAAGRLVSATTSTSNPNVSSSVTLFNGFANHHNLKQSISSEVSADAAIENQRLNVRANILSFYLDVVLNKENLKIAKERVELLQSQLDREEKRVSVGVGNLDAVYNLRSELSNERQNLINADNLVQSSKLTLIQAMQLDPQNNYEVVSSDVEDRALLDKIDPFEQILAEALNVNPSIKSAEADKTAAQYTFKAAAAQRFPSITAFGRIGSRYSTNGAPNPETGDNDPNATFREQFDFNQFEYLNFSLNIPIFDRWRTNTDIQVAKVGTYNAELDYQDALISVTNLVQRAYLDMLNAQTAFSSAQENLEAQRSIFEFIKKRFETGNTDFNAYQESLINKNRAELQLINAKYSIVFRKRILDLYRS
ncbi:MAG: TolC family protein [Bacteroidota bacterium]